MWATSFNGTATSANAMVVGLNNRTASTSATNDTVAVRDSPVTWRQTYSKVLQQRPLC